ncbi:polycystic kidney disease protein 1-like 2 [Plakobranchus ocellatus]|uniref:Polycystic kidney disease protein 1-like 2 n=1 Tax=Plakobranchus ocellatus TaxID=259542 RepID=A0AAV4B722_9GAST|nr:polycystic kidney disease protein 1-like 2 [Plakobranchus ocellatus]
MAGVIGSVQAFNEADDSWIAYTERLEHFFVANDITSEEKKKAILLSSVGATTYKLVKPGDVPYREIIEVVKAHHNPRPSTIVQRFKFNSRITKIDEDEDVEFSSNFFGSFSLSQVIVAPNPIDFSSIAANFTDNLADSPYVLALHCVLLAITLLVVLRLRRLDKRDTASWAYLPLLGNKRSDQWYYAISVHTDFRSSRRLDAVPCLSVIGQYAKSRAVALLDGVRENFESGTTSNFILSSRHSLGNLMEIKIWIDGNHKKELKGGQEQTRTACKDLSGDTTNKETTSSSACCTCLSCGSDNPRGRSSFCLCCFSRNRTEKELENLDWKIEQISIMDLANGKRYTFLVQDWLSEVRGDGRTVRRIPVLDTNATDSGTMFDLISKRKLFDEHLWLSVARRPSPSVFTRAQRFLCAVALLYLAMITNAMWYAGAQNKDKNGNGNTDSSVTESVVFRIGIVEITYRTLYVGVLSALIILLPALLMTYLFRKRRPRETTLQNTHPFTKSKSNIIEPGTDVSSVAMMGNNPRDQNIVLQTPTAETERNTGCDSVSNPVWFLPQRNISSLSTGQVEATLMDPLSRESRASTNLLSVHSTCGSPDSGLGSPVASGRNKTVLSLFAIEDNVEAPVTTHLSPVYPEFYNATCPSTHNYRIDSAPNFSRTLKAYSDSEQTYELWCAEQFNEKKRQEGEAKKAESKKPRLLPWWTIFIAYGIVFLSIASSAVFTLFYSLEWGGRVSLEWMVSLFFSTTTGTFLIEPLKPFSLVAQGNREPHSHTPHPTFLLNGTARKLAWAVLAVSSTAWSHDTNVLGGHKIVFLALLLSCLLRDSAQNHLGGDDIPMKSDFEKVPPTSFPHGLESGEPVEPTDETERHSLRKDIARRRKQLKIKERLLQVLRGLANRILIVVILGAICLHTDTPVAFRQNQKMKSHLNLTVHDGTGNERNITSQSDIYTWLLERAIPNLQPKYWSNQQIMSVYQQKFTSDLEMYRMTPVTVTQKRVKEPCLPAKTIREKFSYPILCYQEYDNDREETASFSPGWLPCSDNCTNVAYTYTMGDDSTLDQYGDITSYSAGGYQVSFPARQDDALTLVQTLRDERWLDHLTRAVRLEAVLFNANTRLFTQVITLAVFRDG